MDTGTSIIGSRNTVSSLLNLNPQVNADVNALNVRQEAAGVTSVTTGTVSSGNNIGGNQQRMLQRFKDS